MTTESAQSTILLESGTNELEVLVFSIGDVRYGVNVAKVREVIGEVDSIPVPKSHPAMVGMFQLREEVLPLIALRSYFASGEDGGEATGHVIVMEFNDMQIGFQVGGVDRIHRLEWTDVRPMPSVQGSSSTVITSVCEIEGGLVMMVDFEKIAFDISDNNAFSGQIHTGNVDFDRSAKRIVLADDSPTIREAIMRRLAESGYTNLTSAGDGQEAWDLIEATVENDSSNRFDAIITDIEMPRMDGLHLCKRIKEHADLKSTPVLVFSSLVSDAGLDKCKAVGANAACTKPQLAEVVEILDDLLSGSAPGEFASGDQTDF